MLRREDPAPANAEGADAPGCLIREVLVDALQQEAITPSELFECLYCAAEEDLMEDAFRPRRRSRVNQRS